MKKEIYVDGRKFISEGKSYLSKGMTVSSVTDEKFRKELAMQMWAKIFSDLEIEYLHAPKVFVDRQEFIADFYLPNAGTFVFVKGFDFDDENYYDDAATKLSKGTEQNVIVAYTDGKFRVVDFYDHKERIERSEEIPNAVSLDSEAMLCQCRRCNSFFITTNYGWWGCRNCGFYDGDNTAKCYLGDEGLCENQ